jgi:hypothetical protein
MKKQLFTLALLAFVLVGVSAQVKFRLTYDKMADHYVVSMVSMETYKNPYNLTATAQITIKALTGKFNPVQVKGLYPGVDWEYNSRSSAPTEAPDFDYFSFALKNNGLLHMPYEKDKELPILTFKNEFGCTGPVQLVDNERDPFMAPNSQRVNIGNTIAILGYGIDAYGGLVDRGYVDCGESYTHSEPGKLNKFDLYPIPADKELFLAFNWGGERETVRVEIVDILGKVHHVKAIDFETGENTVPFDVSKLAAGSYFLKLVGESWEETLDKFQKIRS